MQKALLTVHILLIYIACYGTTWEIAYPYRQHISGQKVEIVAYPFDPYYGSPMAGVTKVLLQGKLLYKLDKFYRQTLFTSSDGRYLAIVTNTNLTDVTSTIHLGIRTLDFGRSAINIYKDGKLIKTFALRDISDTSKILNDGSYFSWGYNFDGGAFRDAKMGCKACIDVYGKNVLARCDTNEIDVADCQECRASCDSVNMEKYERKLAEHAIYVQRDTLFMLTSLGYILRMPFKTLELDSIPFESVIPDKRRFSPPEVYKKINHVVYPEKFGLPLLANKQKVEDGLAAYLGRRVAIDRFDSLATIAVNCDLMISRNGKCFLANCSVQIKDDNSSRISSSKNWETSPAEKQMKDKIEKWLSAQVYDVKLLPKGAEMFKFRDWFSLN